MWRASFVLETYTATLMISGRTQCYPGWTEAYHGNLVSGSIQHHAATQYVCVDQHPQAPQGGGNRDED
ncbi:hypothetical protein KP79_PYT24490 [Mizuhopecten yessoensis]|uniref:Uncharacterized protein n=1 Tax=Mizuhopecten yessoensis TaxID=6573 RepID=A0A210PFY3_MIZYE|nr:hypothetical protein KP79_PYT24490 [Mizuhopecten yessoensis]